MAIFYVVVDMKRSGSARESLATAQAFSAFNLDELDVVTARGDEPSDVTTAREPGSPKKPGSFDVTKAEESVVVTAREARSPVRTENSQTSDAEDLTAREALSPTPGRAPQAEHNHKSRYSTDFNMALVSLCFMKNFQKLLSILEHRAVL
ncbi:unnamed protein product [Haemonchus placei]|uniref:Uncharacterized protein n=1 Tax=Haemonchus placei TaxID=6290 RepID=A0A0N4X354_HAEPC|nr:unnamed protein product [Haemonchus placei]